jgi:hypothetical protein
VIWFRLTHCSFFTAAQLIYSFSFLFSFALVWIAFNLQLKTGHWAYGVLGGCTAVIGSSFLETVLLHRLQLYVKHSGAVVHTMHDIVMKKLKPETSIEKSLHVRKQKYQKVVLVITLAWPVIFAVPVLVVCGGDDVSVGAALTVGIFGTLGGLVTICMLELKSTLRQFGRGVMNSLLSCCWLFVLIPLLTLIPVALAGSDDSNMSTVASWSIGFACVLIMGSVSTVSIALNVLFRRMEYEKLAKYCIIRVQQRLRNVAVRTNLEILREVFDQMYVSTPDSIKQVLMDATYIYYKDLPDNDPDFAVSKEVLTIKDLAKAKSAIKGVDVDEIEDDEEDSRDTKEFSCVQALTALCSGKTAESAGKVSSVDEYLDIQSPDDLSAMGSVKQQEAEGQSYEAKPDIQAGSSQAPSRGSLSPPILLAEQADSDKANPIYRRLFHQRASNILLALTDKKQASANAPNQEHSQQPFIPEVTSDLMKTLVESRVAAQTHKLNQLLVSVMKRDIDEPDLENEQIEAKAVDESARQRLLR